jgi:hypothetical protein
MISSTIDDYTKLLRDQKKLIICEIGNKQLILQDINQSIHCLSVF